MVILQVLPALDSGGVERGTIEITRALVDAGHTALVASAGGRMAPEVEAAGGLHITLPLKSKNPLTIQANIKRLADVIAEHKVQLVHARSRAPAWSAYFAARRMRVPFVTTFHAAYKIGGPLKRLYNSVMARGVRVIAISEYIRAHILSNYDVPADRITLIHRGFDTARFDTTRVDPVQQAELRAAWGLPPHVPVIMCPGRVSRTKGHDVLIEALAQLKDISCILVIAGGDQGRSGITDDLKALADRLGVADRVIFTGPLTIDGPVMSLADIVVAPALLPEAFGRVLVEAQAMEKLVITSNAGGAPETLVPDKTGWLVPPGDVSAIEAALRMFFALSPNERRSRERMARQHVLEFFDTALMCNKTLALYKSVLAEGGEIRAGASNPAVAR